MCGGKKSSPQQPAPAPVAPPAPTGSTAADTSNAAQRQQAIQSSTMMTDTTGGFGSELGGSSTVTPGA